MCKLHFSIIFSSWDQLFLSFIKKRMINYSCHYDWTKQNSVSVNKKELGSIIFTSTQHKSKQWLNIKLIT